MFYLDTAAEESLRAQAKAHGVSQAAIVRARITGARPGAESNSDVAAADAWWDTRPPTRRVSVHQYHAAGPAPDQDPASVGQACLFEGGGDDASSNG